MGWKHDHRSPANVATLQKYQVIMSQRSAFQPTKPTQILLSGLSFPSNPQACALHTRTNIMWVLNNPLELFIPPACSTMALWCWTQESESFSSPSLPLFFTLGLSPKPPLSVSLYCPPFFSLMPDEEWVRAPNTPEGMLEDRLFTGTRFYRARLSWSPLRDLVAVKGDLHELWRGI